VAGPGAPTWPLPPEPPRLLYLGQIGKASDLKPGKSGWKRMSEAVLGGSPESALVSPRGLAIDAQDRLFVVDTEARCIHRFGLVDRQYKLLDLQDQAVTPIDIAIGPAGRLYVVDSAEGAVLVLDDEGNVLSQITSVALKHPTSVAFCPGNALIYVTDTASHQVLAFDEQGALRLGFGEIGSAPGQIYYPTGIDVHDGRVYVCDSFNFRVQVFSLSGEYIASFGEEGDRPGNFSLPKVLAVDREGHIWVVDVRFENVQIFDAAGELLMVVGSEGSDPGEFWLPGGILIDPADRVFVSDTYNRRVQVFQLLPGGGAK